MFKKALIAVCVVAVGCALVAMAEETAPAKDVKATEHVLVIKGDSASVCPCAADCKCTLKEGDDTKCSCGKDVKKVSVKGKFVCLKDNVVADKEGKCATCNGDLKKVE